MRFTSPLTLSPTAALARKSARLLSISADMGLRRETTIFSGLRRASSTATWQGFPISWAASTRTSVSASERGIKAFSPARLTWKPPFTSLVTTASMLSPLSATASTAAHASRWLAASTDSFTPAEPPTDCTSASISSPTLGSARLACSNSAVGMTPSAFAPTSTVTVSSLQLTTTPLINSPRRTTGCSFSEASKSFLNDSSSLLFVCASSSASCIVSVSLASLIVSRPVQ